MIVFRFSARGYHHDLRINSGVVVRVKSRESQLAKADSHAVVAGPDLPFRADRSYLWSNSLCGSKPTTIRPKDEARERKAHTSKRPR
jgi:hypothetical protein